MEIIFRQAMLSDARNVADVYLISRKTFVSFAPSAHSDDEVRQWIAGVLIPSGGVTVAANNANILGMMAVSHDEQMGWIEQLYLHPTAVGQGIGSQLIRRAKSALGPRIRLYTFQANIGSRRFYERHGFQPIAFGDGHNNEEHCPDVLYEFNSSGRPHDDPLART